MASTILYIEDNPDNMTQVQRVVESIGAKFLGASTGLSGMVTAVERQPELILLDINLPDIDGYEIARRMRASGDPYLLYVPIIAISANAFKGEAEKVLAAGCDVYMCRPVNISDLKTRIMTFIEFSRGW